MSDYGVLPSGFVRKRMDVIKSEIQSAIANKTGVDISQNPESLLNVIISQNADQIAQLWELAEGVYYSQYPSTAEGVNLDYAAQLGGVSRKQNERTKYYVMCTGVDGTVLPLGTKIQTNISPVTIFETVKQSTIGRSYSHLIKIKTSSVEIGVDYTITINGVDYTYTSQSGDNEGAILTGLWLATGGDTTEYTISYVTGTDIYLEIESRLLVGMVNINLSGNLQAVEVQTPVLFQSVNYGAYDIPYGVLSVILTTIVGFESCTNVLLAQMGSLRQSDAEFRNSYFQKLSDRSTMMLDSIAAHVLNVSGVYSCTVYENDTDSTDADSRPPHSIEVVVDSVNTSAVDVAIGKAILEKKPAGIATYGSVSVNVPDMFDGMISVNFNRPDAVWVWLKITLTEASGVTLNVAKTTQDVKRIANEYIANAKAGESLYLQDLITPIKNAVSGLAYVDILGYKDSDPNASPSSADYTLRTIAIAGDERAKSSESRIGVVI